MPNHFHLLIRIKPADDLLQIFPKFETLEKLCSSNILSKQFANLFSSFTQAFNKRYSRRGSLFIKNFKRKEVKSDDYFDRVVTYIHLNPIKHRFVSSIKDWEWTSFHDYQHTQPSLVQRAPVLNSLGSLEQFNIFHQAMTDLLATMSNYIAPFEDNGKEFES